MAGMPEAVRPVDVLRVHGAVRTEDADCAAVEEPLETRLHGRPFAVVMRTPGAGRLVRGSAFNVYSHRERI